MRVVCITGMHRSGTSLIARAVNLLGVSLGHEDDLLGPGPDNLAGYWENRAIKLLDEEVLTALGGAWDRPPPLDAGWESDPRLDELHPRAREVIAQEFGDAEGWVGWKDPRTSLLLPFWRRAVDIDTTVLVLRDPREVAASVRVRNRIEPEQASYLWLRHVLTAARDDPGHLRVSYDEFFTDLDAALDRIAAHLGLDAPSQEDREPIRGHVDADLRHEAPVVDGGPITMLATEAYAALVAGEPADLDPLADALARGYLEPFRSNQDAAELSATLHDTVQRLADSERDRDWLTRETERLLTSREDERANVERLRAERDRAIASRDRAIASRDRYLAEADELRERAETLRGERDYWGARAVAVEGTPNEADFDGDLLLPRE